MMGFDSVTRKATSLDLLMDWPKGLSLARRLGLRMGFATSLGWQMGKYLTMGLRSEMQKETRLEMRSVTRLAKHLDLRFQIARGLRSETLTGMRSENLTEKPRDWPMAISRMRAMPMGLGTGWR